MALAAMSALQAVPVPPSVQEIPDLPQVVIQRSAPFWTSLPPEGVVLIVLFVTVGGVLMLLPLVRALARRIEGRTREDPALRTELEQLQARLGEVEVLQHRLQELEERVDFTERLLAQSRSASQLPAR